MITASLTRAMGKIATFSVLILLPASSAYAAEWGAWEKPDVPAENIYGVGIEGPEYQQLNELDKSSLQEQENEEWMNQFNNLMKETEQSGQFDRDRFLTMYSDLMDGKEHPWGTAFPDGTIYTVKNANGEVVQTVQDRGIVTIPGETVVIERTANNYPVLLFQGKDGSGLQMAIDPQYKIFLTGGHTLSVQLPNTPPNDPK